MQDVRQYIAVTYDTNSSPGDTPIIWNFHASHPQQYNDPYTDYSQSWLPNLTEICRCTCKCYKLQSCTCLCTCNFNCACGLPIGWNRKWGNRSTLHVRARTSKLFDRDYVWFVTQTMVFINWTLWEHYKVHPKSLNRH